MFDCPPMVFYLVLVVIQVATGIYSGYYSKKNYNNSTRLEITSVLLHVACWALCAFVLHLFCASGNTGAAWVIVLMPMIILMISGVGSARLIMNGVNMSTTGPPLVGPGGIQQN
jgi:uncharacterized membrane protein